MGKFPIGSPLAGQTQYGGPFGAIRPHSEYEQRYVYEPFRSRVVVQAPAGGAATGVTGDTNILRTRYNIFEYHIKGAGQTIVAPTLGANGYDFALDLTNDEGVEVTTGILARTVSAFTVGTDRAVFARCVFTIADVSGTDDCAFGWRKAEAYQANIDDYDEMACLNAISGAINIETILNNAATVTTDTTDTWADTISHSLQVNVSASGVVTYLIDGVAPTTVAAYTFDAAEVIVPFLFHLHAVDLDDTFVLREWEVGLQDLQ